MTCLLMLSIPGYGYIGQEGFYGEVKEINEQHALETMRVPDADIKVYTPEMNAFEVGLKPNGIVVIDYVSIDDEHYGRGLEIEKDTFIINVEGEENIPHHYSTIGELEDLYSNFRQVEIKPIDYYFFDNYNNKHTIKAFVVISIK
ncbi:hypothetical protein [Sedimentibacter sp.]|uniref:hypothetical protein n=1 Tax=Sedimentibacter sp. TaxID=1960295 RepID=UPI0028A9A4D7|nr:hypothetical protein [Sedimentibacter sp.]